MAANSSLGAALGGEGDAERLPGRPLPALVLDRLGYPAGAGAPRLVSAAWRREADRLFGRERDLRPTRSRSAQDLLVLPAQGRPRALLGVPSRHVRPGRRRRDPGAVPPSRGLPRRRPLHPRVRRKASNFRVHNRMFLILVVRCLGRQVVHAVLARRIPSILRR